MQGSLVFPHDSVVMAGAVSAIFLSSGNRACAEAVSVMVMRMGPDI